MSLIRVECIKELSILFVYYAAVTSVPLTSLIMFVEYGTMISGVSLQVVSGEKKKKILSSFICFVETFCSSSCSPHFCLDIDPVPERSNGGARLFFLL